MDSMVNQEFTQIKAHFYLITADIRRSITFVF